MASIQIIANGETCETEAGILIPDFLRTMGKDPNAVVVEHNGRALTRAEVGEVALAAGDQLEIVRIVAGG